MLILASSSPRRHELLSLLGFDFSVVKPDIDETYADASPEQYVSRLATEKACAVLSRYPDNLIIAADTTVVLSGNVLNKPINRDDAADMLRQLSGNTHQVLTGFCVANTSQSVTRVVASDVTFRTLTEGEIRAYCETGEPDDKAGAYAVQGIGAAFIERLDGSYSGVMGLPSFALCEVLREFGVSPLGVAVDLATNPVNSEARA